MKKCGFFFCMKRMKEYEGVKIKFQNMRYMYLCLFKIYNTYSNFKKLEKARILIKY